MGKTPKPLTIYVHESLLHWPEWEQLKAQGHTVEKLMASEDVHLIVGPTSWYMTELHKEYLDLAIKAARSRRYAGKPKKKETTK